MAEILPFERVSQINKKILTEYEIGMLERGHIVYIRGYGRAIIYYDQSGVIEGYIRVKKA